MSKASMRQLKELVCQVADGRISGETVAWLLRAPNAIQWWTEFYRKEFKLKLELLPQHIPPQPDEGKWRLIVVASGLTIEGAYQHCKTLFGAWKYTEKPLDKVVTVNDRNPGTGSYAIWVRDTAEADEELKDTSANQLAERGAKTETLLERLIHEVAFFRETGKRLDVVNVTLCAGSRDAGGDVPHVFTGSDGGLGVDWSIPGNANENLRAREAVSL